MPKNKILPTEQYLGKGLAEVQQLSACHHTERVCGREKRWVTKLSKSKYKVSVFIKPFDFQENRECYFIMGRK